MMEKEKSSEKTANEAKGTSCIRRLYRRIQRGICGRSVDETRLAGDLAYYWRRLDYLKPNPDDYHWSDPARSLLNSASKALEEGENDLGWRYLDYARSFLILGMKEEDFRAEAQSIINEAESPNKKVNAWRLKTIRDDLCQECKLKDDLKPIDVFNASVILFESHHNRYIKIWRIKSQLIKLALIAALAIILLLIAVPQLEDRVELNNRFILSVVLFGIMGASVSGILTVARTGMETRIPDQLIDFWILLVKIVVGAASALAILVFIYSDVLKYTIDNQAQIMAISFAAGFSERLVTSAVESISKK